MVVVGVGIGVGVVVVVVHDVIVVSCNYRCSPRSSGPILILIVIVSTYHLRGTHRVCKRERSTRGPSGFQTLFGVRKRVPQPAPHKLRTVVLDAIDNLLFDVKETAGIDTLFLAFGFCFFGDSEREDEIRSDGDRERQVG